MTVPAHNLYDFIHQVTENRFWLLYFFPWGAKDLHCVIDHIKDYNSVKGHGGIADPLGEKIVSSHDINISPFSLVRNFQPVLFCHDQEPLNYSFYEDGQPLMSGMERLWKENYTFPLQNLNLRSCIAWSWQKKWILLHSEVNSPEVIKYESTGRYQGAFWWSHALLARDWYRFAEHDARLHSKIIDHRFLIYSRDTTGSRAYRKTLLDQLGNDSDYFLGDPHAINADASAFYNSDHFTKTGISVVLETLFDDPRIHHTEKILRAIACNHPFIVAAGPGSLAFLKKYGFETFDPWINESYDLEHNSDLRLQMIIKEIKRIKSLEHNKFCDLLAQCQSIAYRNQKRFFSDEFLQQVIAELRHNVDHAFKLTGNLLDPSFWCLIRQWRRINEPDYRPNAYTLNLVKHLRRSKGSLEQYQRHQHCLDYKSSTNSDDV